MQLLGSQIAVAGDAVRVHRRRVGVFGRLGQVPGLGFVLALVLLVGHSSWRSPGRSRRVARPVRGSARVARRRGRVPARHRRSCVRVSRRRCVGQFKVGPGRARQSRYVYIVVAMALPTIGVAADAIARRWRVLTIPVVALLVAGVPGNIHQLRIYTEPVVRSTGRSSRTEVLEAPRLPFARSCLRRSAPVPRRSTGSTSAGSSRAFPRAASRRRPRSAVADREPDARSRVAGAVVREVVAGLRACLRSPPPSNASCTCASASTLDAGPADDHVRPAGRRPVEPGAVRPRDDARGDDRAACRRVRRPVCGPHAVRLRGCSTARRRARCDGARSSELLGAMVERVRARRRARAPRAGTRRAPRSGRRAPMSTSCASSRRR